MADSMKMGFPWICSLFMIQRSRANAPPRQESLADQCQKSASKMMMGMGTPSSHNKMERIKPP
jgi:hypothetical protein